MNSAGEPAGAGLPPPARIALLALGFGALLAGVGAGLARAGWDVPFDAVAIAAWHGPLMVSGFFGTVISLERAVALARPWAYLGPLAGALGTLAVVSGHGAAMPACILVASFVLFAASREVVLRQRADFTLTLAIGAACWAAGNALFAFDADMLRVLPWWIAFLVLTIAGERLELSRFAPRPPWAGIVFRIVAGATLAGCVVSLALPRVGWGLLAAGLLALALWLGRYDLARRTVRQEGLTRFMAVCLLAGYAWLAAGGALLLYHGAVPGTPLWDAALHAVLLGFVFSMVFGHAPVILPAVTRVRMAYSGALYLPVVLLHASVGARVAGDLFGEAAWRAWAAAANAVALAAFVIGTVSMVLLGRRAPVAVVP